MFFKEFFIYYGYNYFFIFIFRFSQNFMQLMENIGFILLKFLNEKIAS